MCAHARAACDVWSAGVNTVNTVNTVNLYGFLPVLRENTPLGFRQKLRVSPEKLRFSFRQVLEYNLLPLGTRRCAPTTRSVTRFVRMKNEKLVTSD